VVAGPTLTIPVLSSYSIEFIPPRSINIASLRTLHTGQEWPPDRTLILISSCSAIHTASTTSFSEFGWEEIEMEDDG
jgi:hypothetical protein